MNPIVERVCQARCVKPEQFFGEEKSSPVVAARQEAINRLSRAGLGPKEIAAQTKLHVQTVYYWLSPTRRDALRAKSKSSFRLKSAGVKKLTKDQRQEIVDTYLADKAAGTALACSRGLSPLYAFKLVTALGLLPKRGER